MNLYEHGLSFRFVAKTSGNLAVVFTSSDKMFFMQSCQASFLQAALMAVWKMGVPSRFAKCITPLILRCMQLKQTHWYIKWLSWRRPT